MTEEPRVRSKAKHHTGKAASPKSAGASHDDPRPAATLARFFLDVMIQAGNVAIRQAESETGKLLDAAARLPVPGRARKRGRHARFTTERVAMATDWVRHAAVEWQRALGVPWSEVYAKAADALTGTPFGASPEAIAKSYKRVARQQRQKKIEAPSDTRESD